MPVEDTDLTDPEDAYDATDEPREKLRNFIRRIEWLVDHLNLDRAAIGDRLVRLRDDIHTLRDETT